jgi:Ser/Thr protein kinase RdoA (MazF antagonist)
MITTEQIQKYVLPIYAIGDILNIEQIETSGNLLFEIEASTGKYVLRFNPPSGPQARSSEEVREEVLFLQYLLESDFPVGEIVKTSDGQSVVEVEGVFGYLRTYLEGEAFEDPKQEEIYKVGVLLGGLHNLSKAYRPTYKRVHKWNPGRVKQYWPENKEIILNSGFEFAPDFVRIFSEQLERLSFKPGLASGMIHEDLGARHVLWEEGEINGVIDFDRMYVGLFIMDIGQAIRGWCTSEQEVTTFLEGYEESRALSDNEKDALGDAIAFAFLERAQSFVLRGIAEGDEEMIGLGLDELESIL